MDGPQVNVTLEDCANMGGTAFKPNDPTKQTVNPQTGQPL